jgi:hypothetical protein
MVATLLEECTPGSYLSRAFAALQLVHVALRVCEYVLISTSLLCLNRLFLDGALAGQMVGGEAYVGEDSVLKQVSGGLPASLSGPIHLCARSDDDARRHFDGRIAYLGKLFDPPKR